MRKLGYTKFFGGEVSALEHFTELLNDNLSDIYCDENMIGEKDYTAYNNIKPIIKDTVEKNIAKAAKCVFPDLNDEENTSVYEFLMDKFVNIGYRMGYLSENIYHHLPKINIKNNESIMSISVFKKRILMKS